MLPPDDTAVRILSVALDGNYSADDQLVQLDYYTPLPTTAATGISRESTSTYWNVIANVKGKTKVYYTTSTGGNQSYRHNIFGMTENNGEYTFTKLSYISSQYCDVTNYDYIFAQAVNSSQRGRLWFA